MEEYKKRDAILVKMGYSSYSDYLGSDFWRRFRKRFLRKNPECRLCGNTSEEIHHSSYDKKTLKLKRFDTLFALCSKCHEKIEFSQDGKWKLSLKKANNKLLRMIKARNKRKETPLKKTKKEIKEEKIRLSEKPLKDIKPIQINEPMYPTKKDSSTWKIYLENRKRLKQSPKKD